ncbi:MAG TPA: hypothetical protein DHV62_04865, partial [Elusimicrobia bacterium]|nr:hypothetical protein [Elusimicrobiota bacterium]
MKDKSLKINLKKESLGEQYDFKIFKVDSEWIKNNLDVTFGTGGHGLVHSYIPMDEIWVDPKVQKKESLIRHEIIEHLLMKEQDLNYKKAHKKTSEAMQKNSENKLIESLS